MTPRVRRLAPVSVVLPLLVAFVSACAGAGSPSAPPSPSSPPASPPTSPSGPPSGPVGTPDEAVARVIHEHPEFASLRAFNPDMVGQCCWYRVTQVADGYEVVMRVGWGDCPSGCIDEHVWTFQVGNDGAVELVSESGDPVDPGVMPTPSS